MNVMEVETFLKTIYSIGHPNMKAVMRTIRENKDFQDQQLAKLQNEKDEAERLKRLREEEKARLREEEERAR